MVSTDSASNVAEEHQDRVRAQFEEWDIRGNGFIGRVELRSMLARLRKDFTVSELDAIMDAVDSDGTGTVDYQNFVSWAFSGQSQSASSSSAGCSRVTISRASARRSANHRSRAGYPSTAASESCTDACRCSTNGGDDSARGRSCAGSSRGSRNGRIRSSSGSSRSASSSHSPRAGAGCAAGETPASSSQALAETLRANAPRRLWDADTLSRLPPLRLGLSAVPAASTSAASSGVRTAPSQQRSVRLSEIGTSRSVAESVQFPVRRNRGNAGRGPHGRLRGPHDGPVRDVHTPAMREAMQRLRTRVETGQAILTDRLLQRLTNTTVHSGAGDADVIAAEASEAANDAPEEAKETPRLDLEFGCDSAACQQQEEEGNCGICFEEDIGVVSLCGRSSCTDRYCISCSRRHAETMVSSALYAMPWLKCPSCAKRVETKVWSGWVEEDVFKRYLNNGEALLTFRCPSCHETGNLFRKTVPEHQQDHSQHEVFQKLSEETRKSLRGLWAEYTSGQQSAEDFVAALVRLVLTSSENDKESISDMEGTPPEQLQSLMSPDGLPSLVADPERRCSMQLAFLRRFPKIRTPCCNAQMCFKCKVSGWHLDETCESRQRREVHKDVQFCPGCSVPTVKSEGCDHIVCVCGESWTWAPNPVWNLVRTAQIEVLDEMFTDGFDVNYADEETGETLLHAAAENGNLETLALLLRHGADVDRLDAAGSTILAAAVRRPYRAHTLDVLRALLEHRADVNASISPEGGFVITEALRTLAYGRAAEEGEEEREEAADRQRGVELIGLLLNTRASVGVRDEDLDGATPLLEAIRGGFDDVAVLLIDAQVANPEVGVAASLGLDSAAPRPQAVHPGEDLQEPPPPPPLPQRPAVPQGEDSELLSPSPPPLGPLCSSLEASDHSGNTPLYLAVANRRRVVVAALLAARVSPDTRGPSSTPPLHAAISNQDHEAFGLLLASNADANLTSEDGHLALHAALRALYRDHSGLDESAGRNQSGFETCHKMAMRVIPETRDLNVATQDGQTALGATAANGSLELMQSLLDHRAVPDHGARGGSAPLGLAAQCGQPDAVRLLLAHGANVARVDRGGQTALHRLAGNWLWQDSEPRRSDDQWISCKGRRLLGRAEAALALAEANADINSLDIIARTPLLLASDPPTQVAVSTEQQAVVEALLEKRAHVNLASSTGITPLVAAVQKDVEAVVHLLLRFNVDTNSPEPLSGARPLKIAIQRMHVGLVKALTENGAEVSVVDRRGQSAAAAWVESFASAYKAKRGPWAPKQRIFEDMLQSITAGRTEQAFVPSRGVSPLQLAWKQLDGLGQRAAIQMLLQARADANSTDGTGRTVLHAVCGTVGSERSSASMMELIQSLLRARADAARESEEGETPLDLAVNAGPGANQVYKALIDSLPELSLKAPRWSRLLFRELANGNERTITALVPRTGAAHFNEHGQGPLEAFFGHSLFRSRPPWPAEALGEELQETAEDQATQLRCAEVLQRHGAALTTPSSVWSKHWPSAKAKQALQRLEELGEQGPRHLASLANDANSLISPPPALVGVLAAACALVGMEPEASVPPPPTPVQAAARGVKPASVGSSFAAWAARYRPAVQQLLAGEGSMLLPRLACAAAPEAGPTPLPAHALRELRRFLEDSAASGFEALEKAGGPAAVQLGAWVRATFELLHVPKLLPASLKAIALCIEGRFEDQPGMRQRWLRLVLTSVANVDAEDGAGGHAVHLALRCRDLGVGDAFLPLLHRGASVGRLDGAGASVLELLRERAWEALGGLPSPMDGNAAEAPPTTSHSSDSSQSNRAGGGGAVEALADAIAEVERCSQQFRLQEAAAQQCLVVESMEVQLREVVAQVEELKGDIEADLARTAPRMEEAMEALDKLECEELGSTQTLAEPPPALALVLAATCEILGALPERKKDAASSSIDAAKTSQDTAWSYEACMECWPAAQKLLAAGFLVQQIHCYDKTQVSAATIARLSPLQGHPDLAPDGPLQASPTGAALALWLRAFLAQREVAAAVAPKRDRLQELTKRLESSETSLSEELRRLQELQAAAEGRLATAACCEVLRQPLGAVANLAGPGRIALATRGQAVRDALQLTEEV